jgi:hypothetical protein
MREQLELQPDNTYFLEGADFAREPLYKSRDFAFQDFVGADILAKINAGQTDFYLIDLRTATADATQDLPFAGDYLLATDDFFTSNGQQGAEPLQEPDDTDCSLVNYYNIGSPDADYHFSIGAGKGGFLAVTNHRSDASIILECNSSTNPKA